MNPWRRNYGSWYLALALGLLVACASMTPEDQYLKAYQTASAAVVTTTTLLNREVIGSKPARHVLTIGVTTKTLLDESVADLEKCRAAGGDCKVTEAGIKMASKISIALEQYLEEVQ